MVTRVERIILIQVNHKRGLLTSSVASDISGHLNLKVGALRDRFIL